jgi:flagellar export protein FliJ
MAGKFRFRLQVVLERRERLEREKQIVVARLERERLEVEEKLRGLQRAISESGSEMRSQLGGGQMRGAVSIQEVRLQAGASLHLATRARLVALELAGVYQRLERAREELLKAARARRAVELLKERRQHEWKLERNRVEGHLVDEIGMQGFVRKARAMEGGEA